MRFEPGFVKELREDLAQVKPEIKARLARPGALTEQQLLGLVSCTPQEVVSDAEHATASDVVPYDDLASWQAGIDAVRAGEVAFIVLAGGAGTRAGGPKPFMRLPKLGITLMANKLVQSAFATHDGEVVQAPVWFMTSPGLLEQFARHLEGLVPQPAAGTVFEQFESYRLSVDNRLVFTEPGVPELHPTGHGDVGPALVESGVLVEHPNVKYCAIVNCDNVLASLDPVLLTHHIESGHDVTCEVVERKKAEHGGVLAWVDGKLQVVERFRLPDGFADEARYHNTNSMIVNVAALRAEIPWCWYRVRKQAGSRLVIQHERLLQQYTVAFKAGYVLVDRARRYLPVKTEEDLQRADEVLNGNRIR
jgi:UDP-N-acetylglucosamine pyrophosphorylase